MDVLHSKADFSIRQQEDTMVQLYLDRCIPIQFEIAGVDGLYFCNFLFRKVILSCKLMCVDLQATMGVYFAKNSPAMLVVATSAMWLPAPCIYENFRTFIVLESGALPTVEL